MASLGFSAFGGGRKEGRKGAHHVRGWLAVRRRRTRAMVVGDASRPVCDGRAYELRLAPEVAGPGQRRGASRYGGSLTHILRYT